MFPVKTSRPALPNALNFLTLKPQRRMTTSRLLAPRQASDQPKHICETPFIHPPFSAAATPFGWLLKERAWGREWAKGKIDSQSIVERYGIDSRPEYEPEDPD